MSQDNYLGKQFRIIIFNQFNIAINLSFYGYVKLVYAPEIDVEGTVGTKNVEIAG